LNQYDDTPARKVWHNYWESRLTFQASYLARLQYVHQNAVKHRLVTTASLYPWCSAGWLEYTVSPATVKALARFQTDKVQVDDNYEPFIIDHVPSPHT
jgi:putative transposase